MLLCCKILGLIDLLNCLVFNVEIKSEGEYFMTSIKGRYFWRIMDERL